MRIHPFPALRPPADRVADVASVPYDVVDRDEAIALTEGKPDSFLRVVRPDLELPAEAPADTLHARARENFDALVARGALVRDPTPQFYLYRQTLGEHVQTGIVACCHVADYDAGLVKQHEHTRREKEDDRVRHVDALSANSGPVFLTFRDQPAVSEQIAAACAGAPEQDFVAPDDVRHTVWRLPVTEPLRVAFEAVPAVYIADGHHRAASAARVGRERHAANPEAGEGAEHHWFLTVLFPASELKILPYNRCVHALNDHTAASLLAALEPVFRIERNAPAAPASPGHFQMYLEGSWYGLTPIEAPPDDPVARLDVSLLQDRLLGPLLGIEDPRTAPGIDFVGGIRGTAELERRVDSGRDALAFSLFATTVDQLLDVADAGRVMPPKSTWFEPKLRSGLFVHTLD